ncbi:unknown [Bacteroides sp. CAG:443]|nr:unknown [Bacteroides sp. CAG:443]
MQYSDYIRIFVIDKVGFGKLFDDGLTLWHCFRLVADEQPLMLDYSFALKSKLISFSLAYSNNSKSLLLYILLIFFVTAAKVIFFILWSNTSKLAYKQLHIQYVYLSS